MSPTFTPSRAATMVTHLSGRDSARDPATILGIVKPRRTADSGNLITFLSQLTASEQGSRIAKVVDVGNPGLNGESQLVLNGE